MRPPLGIAAYGEPDRHAGGDCPDGSTLRPVRASPPGAITRARVPVAEGAALIPPPLIGKAPAMNRLDRALAIGRRARRPAPGCLRGVSRGCRAVAPETARADKISHPIAVFDGLDKITGRIISFEVAINETVQFGALQITPRVCYSRPLTDAPQTDAFAQVDESTSRRSSSAFSQAGCSPTARACTASSTRFSIFG